MNEELEASLGDFMRNCINESVLSVKEIEIFMEWVKLNHYTLEESK